MITVLNEWNTAYTDKRYQTPFPHGSKEYEDRVAECVEKLTVDDPELRAVVNFGGIIYRIWEYGSVEQYVVDEWGKCGILYGGLWEHSQEFLKDGGDVDLVTFTDKLGNTYTPYKNRKSIKVTTPNGAEFDLQRGKAENMFMSYNK
jgi:hypothetical protein